MRMSARQLKIIAWTTTAVVAGLAIMAWGEGLRWRFGSLSIYRIFPLFGLLAFSFMWVHYVMAALRQSQGLNKRVLKPYFEITSILVLIFLVLHPGLLAWQMWHSGYGLPPGSLWQYVGVSLRVWILAGAIAITVFLLYESRRWLSSKSWWPLLQIASDIAIVLIFFHGLRLGSNLRSGWLVGVWWFYGISLIGALLYMYYKKLQPDKSITT